MPRGPPGADQPQHIMVPLDEDDEQDARSDRLADDAGVLRVALVLDDEGQGVAEDCGSLLEGVPCFRAFSSALRPSHTQRTG